jgi:hypothetical protein
MNLTKKKKGWLHGKTKCRANGITVLVFWTWNEYTFALEKITLSERGLVISLYFFKRLM